MIAVRPRAARGAALAAFALGAAAVLPAAATAAAVPVAVNEVESSGGTPGDWIEFYNNGGAPVDLSGYVVKDNDDTHAYTIPAGTTIAAGGYYVAEESALGYGLGGADSARLFTPDGSIVDSHSWAAHAAATTYGRCPDGTGTFATTATVTKGAANDCGGTTPPGPAATAWPGSQSVSAVDPLGLATSNLSGLAYEGSGSTAPGTLWAVLNGPGTLHKLVKNGSEWAPAAGDWAAGKALHYTDGSGDPDAEGVTLAGGGSGAGIYVSTERDNADSKVSRPAVLRFDPNASGTSLNATAEWDLTSDLPPLGANKGLEAIAYIPDSVLVAKGFRDENRGATYDPAAYPGHGQGLFFVGVEENGKIYAYALSDGGTYNKVATIDSGFPSIMDLEYEPQTGRLWAQCDDTCNGRSATLDVDGASGALKVTALYERPAGMANINNEGFAITPKRECAGGKKPVFWSDDNDADGHSLREGTIDCAIEPSNPTISAIVTSSAPRNAAGWYRTAVTVTFSCTDRGAAVTEGCPAPVTLTDGAGQSVTGSFTGDDNTTVSATAGDINIDTVAPVVRVSGVRAGAFYWVTPALRALATDESSGVASTTVGSRALGWPNRVATATATDQAGNTARATIRYMSIW